MFNASAFNAYLLMHNWMFDSPGDDFPQPPLSSTTSSVKAFNSLARASIKNVDGLAIASVKTINGLS